MPESSTPAQSGIAQLEAKRQQSGRTVPPPKHPPRASVVVLAPAPSSAEQEPLPEAPAAVSAVSPAPVEPEVQATAQGTPEAAVEVLVRSTIHFGAAQDRFLNTVAHAGRMNRPKTDASRSAVTRLAVERLEREMTPEQIVAELASRAAGTTRPGRKRL